MTDKYAVLDADGRVVNMVVWDGASAFDPGSGLSLMKAAEGFIIGGMITGGKFIPPVNEDEPSMKPVV